MVELHWFNPETRKSRRMDLCVDLDHALELYQERLIDERWPIGADVFAFERVEKVWSRLSEEDETWYVFPMGLPDR